MNQFSNEPPQPGQPFYPPPAQPPKRSRRNLWIGIIVVVLVLACIGGIANAIGGQQSSSPGNTPVTQATATPTFTPTPSTPTPTPTPKPPPKWTTIQSFKGNGNKKTGTFTVPDDWRLAWSCNPSSFYGGQYNLIVDVYNADGSFLDLAAINTICQKGNTSDFTEEHSGGPVYLDVQSEAAWTINIQVLK